MIHDDTNYSFDIYGRLNRDKVVCQDQYIGTLNYNESNDKFEYEKGDIFQLQKQKRSGEQQRKNIDYSCFNKDNNPIIVVVLESPHISEFCITGQNFTTAPAWGATGDKFNTQFIKLLNNYLSSKINKTSYDVYLVNAIRYQTSLGMSPICSLLRDYVFKDMWNNLGFADDFKERINILKPDVVINAVTKNLKQLVDKVIKSTLQGNRCLFNASEHPSVWDKNTTLS